MSDIFEEILYRAHNEGKREKLLNNLKNIQQENPDMPLEEIYKLAYKQLMGKP
jgi:hypothetical protein